jgi:hypothetical protein
MARPNMRKRKYTGLLAEPIEYQLPIVSNNILREPPQGLPKRWGDVWTSAVIAGRQEDARRASHGLTAWAERIKALIDHFQINVQQPGWSRDLVLSLACRHEASFMNGLSYAGLFARYSIDPSDREADLNLALRLAADHVPGFAFKREERPRGRLETREIINLFMAVAAVSDRLKKDGKEASDSQVVSILLNYEKLAAIIPGPAASAIAQIIRENGNYRRTTSVPMSERTLRNYLLEFRKAWPDFIRGNATAFQHQIVLEVLPFFKWAQAQPEPQLADPLLRSNA